MITVNPSDVALTCNPSCTKAFGTTVSVTVTGHFALISPILWPFTGGQNVTFTRTASADVVITPGAAAAASPITDARPDPDASPSPTVPPRARRSTSWADANAKPDPVTQPEPDAGSDVCPTVRGLHGPSSRTRMQPVVFTSTVDTDERGLRDQLLALGLRRHAVQRRQPAHREPRVRVEGDNLQRHPDGDDAQWNVLLGRGGHDELMTTPRRTCCRHAATDGQAVVEFSLAILVFLMMVIGLFDFGRAVYMYNGVSEAAREIARQTIVHPGLVLGASTETQAAISVQKRLVPGMATPTFACVDVSGAAVPDSPCQSGDYVRVTATANYKPVSLLGMLPQVNLTSSASMLVP